MAAVYLVACTVAFAKPILREIGALYIQDGPPVAADIVVVLAGDFPGERILKGAEVARQGFAPLVLADSSDAAYGRTESELAIEYAIQKGYSPGLFVKTSWSAHSTVEEAKAADCGIATPRYSSRAGRHVFMAYCPIRKDISKAGAEMEIHMVGADDPEWHGGNWWLDRQGKKIFFLEGVKTIADYLGI